MITELKIELMEDVFFASSEFGNEYHTYGLIANTAIPYAIGLVTSPYLKYKTAHHREDFKTLRDQGIYITPATFPNPVDFRVDRFNARPESYDVKWHDGKVEPDDTRKYNYPDEGWIKFIHKGNIAYCYVFSPNRITFPNYIRLGKFMSKCKVTPKEVIGKEVSGNLLSDIILRAEDIDPAISIQHCEKIVIQHGTYLQRMAFQGKGIHIQSTIFQNAVIPANTHFYAVEGV